jgi:hypothetical protein
LTTAQDSSTDWSSPGSQAEPAAALVALIREASDPVEPLHPGRGGPVRLGGQHAGYDRAVRPLDLLGDEGEFHREILGVRDLEGHDGNLLDGDPFDPSP